MCTKLVDVCYICRKTIVYAGSDSKRISCQSDKNFERGKSGQSVMLTSRVGNFKIVPITSEDEIVKRDILESLKEVKEHLEGRIDLPNARDLVF